jgi:hypothetical protein
MATFDDFNGVYFTIEGIRSQYDCKDVEFLIVDNNPGSQDGKMTATFAEKIGAKYIPFNDIKGTTQSRNLVFSAAQGEFVACMDSHIFFADYNERLGNGKGARLDILPRLLDFFKANRDTQDLYSGPIIMDDLRGFATHFDDHWRGQMWGTWASAYRCSCKSPITFSVNPPASQKDNCAYRLLAPGYNPVTLCGGCGQRLPTNVPYVGHEPALQQMGFHRLAANPLDEPFEVPGQGLGFFASRKDAWLGFNKHFRGFGGEEMYIHEKYRQAGRKTICLPFLRWGHRFGRARPAGYPLTVWHKVRNYVLGHVELGLSLEPVYVHFVVEAKVVGQADWEYLVADPVGHITSQRAMEAEVSNGKVVSLAKEGDAESIYQWLRSRPRDLNKHMDKLREFASQSKTVTEFTHRRESTAAFVAAGATVTSYNLEEDEIVARLKEISPSSMIVPVPSENVDKIEPTGMLFIDSLHTERCLTRELMTHGPQVEKYIALHDTVLHANHGEDGGPGLAESLRKFLSAFPEWYFAYHTNQQYGLSILSRVKGGKAVAVPFWAPTKGPGSELSKVISGLGIEIKQGCDCKAKAGVMDVWGVKGCEIHFDSIVSWMKEGQDKWGWSEKLGAGLKAILSGLAFQINPADPFPGLVRKAIENAKKEIQ